MNGKTVSRRGFLKTAGLTMLGGGAAAFLAACATPTPQVIEKVVEKPVEKVVEKVVTPTAMPTTLRNVKLQYASYGSEGFQDKLYGKLFTTMRERFRQMYPMLDFDWVQVNYQKQAMAMAAGNAADVALINVPSAWPLMFRKQITNLQPAINADPEWKGHLDKFAPVSLESYTMKGDLYAIPNSYETSGTIYNEDLLKAAGVKLPHEYSETEWDWNALVETAKGATKGEGKDRVWGLVMHPDVQSGLGDMVYSNGGGWLSDDGLSSRVAEDVFIEAAEFAGDTVLKHKVAPSQAGLADWLGNQYQLFINQKGCILISGDWAFGWIINNMLPDKRFKLNWMTAPVSPKTKKPNGVGHYTAFYAWSGSKYLPEALAFLKFNSTKECQELWTLNWENSPIIAPRMDSQDHFWNVIGPKLVPNLNLMKRAFEVARPYPRTPLMNASIAIGYVNTDLLQLWDGQIQKSTREVCIDIDKKINADLQKAAAG
jgi:ABC-type glycerol-3-phosphate transport system substrate-binding protein